MSGLLRFLFYFLLIYVVVRFFRQYVAPLMRSMEKFNHDQNSRFYSNKREKVKQNRSRDEGEYVDFTEVM